MILFLYMYVINFLLFVVADDGTAVGSAELRGTVHRLPQSDSLSSKQLSLEPYLNLPQQADDSPHVVNNSKYKKVTFTGHYNDGGPGPGEPKATLPEPDRTRRYSSSTESTAQSSAI